MLPALIRPLPACALLRALDRATQARSMPRDRLGHLGLADDQRRQQAHDVVAGADREQLLVAQRVDQIAVRHRPHLQADQQALAAHLRDHRRMPVLDLGEPLLEQQRHLADVIEEAGLEHDVEHGVAGRHRERIAAEGRAVGAGRHALGRLRGGEHRADREAAAEALGERPSRRASRRASDSRTVSPSRPMPVCTSSKREQQAVLVAERRERPEELRPAERTPPSPCTGSIRMPAVSGPIARLTASMSPSGTWSKPSIIGPKPSRCFAVLGRGQRRQRAAVEAAFEGDDAIALGMAVRRLVLAHHLDDAFHRLGAGVGEEHRVGKARAHSRSASRSPSGMR